jgi:hypothetical protein
VLTVVAVGLRELSIGGRSIVHLGGASAWMKSKYHCQRDDLAYNQCQKSIKRLTGGGRSQLLGTVGEDLNVRRVLAEVGQLAVSHRRKVPGRRRAARSRRS